MIELNEDDLIVIDVHDGLSYKTQTKVMEVCNVVRRANGDKKYVLREVKKLASAGLLHDYTDFKMSIDEPLMESFNARKINIEACNPINDPRYFREADKVGVKLKDLKPKKYIVNRNATILFWEDGSKTIVKKSPNDRFDKRIGFLTAYFQKHSGMTRTQTNKFLDGLEVTEDKKPKMILSI